MLWTKSDVHYYMNNLRRSYAVDGACEAIKTKRWIYKVQGTITSKFKAPGDKT